MIHKNLLSMRKKYGYSQEMVAEKIGVSRQTVSKWESGESVPDLAFSNRLAELYDVTLDELVNYEDDQQHGMPPKGKYIFGAVKVGERGQIVIPVKARRIFGIKPGDSLMVLGDINQGLALTSTEFFLQGFEKLQEMEEHET